MFIIYEPSCGLKQQNCWLHKTQTGIQRSFQGQQILWFVHVQVGPKQFILDHHISIQLPPIIYLYWICICNYSVYIYIHIYMHISKYKHVVHYDYIYNYYNYTNPDVEQSCIYSIHCHILYIYIYITICSILLLYPYINTIHLP
jgi:hypothetical protein